MKPQLHHNLSTGRHFGSHSIVKFERRSPQLSIAQKLRRLIADLFPVTAEPRIREILNATGDRVWSVYDANRSCTLEFDSEQAVLEWLEEPRQPMSRFERIWN